MGNGTETLHPHGGRRLTVPGVGLVELISGEDGTIERVIATEHLSAEQHERLMNWIRNEWPRRNNN